MHGDSPGGPVVKNPPSSAGGEGLIPDQGTKIPDAPQVKKKKKNQNIKQKQYFNKFSKDFKTYALNLQDMTAFEEGKRWEWEDR